LGCRGREARKLKLGREEVRYLVTEKAGRPPPLFERARKALALRVGDRLDLETMAEVLGRGRAQSVFKFTDAVASGDAGSALRLLGRLLEEGEPPLRILALLDRLVGQLRIAKDAQASGRKDSSLAGLLGAPPSAAKALGERARRLSLEFLRRAVDALAHTDRLLKSSRLPHRVVMEGLVLELARGRSAMRMRRAGRAATVAVSGVLVDDALLDHHVDQRRGLRKKLLRFGEVRGLEGLPKLLDLASKAGPIRSIADAALGVLPYPLDGGSTMGQRTPPGAIRSSPVKRLS
jgi:hypothetical protein